MNNLSWLIYAIHVFDAVRVLAITALALLGAGLVVTAFVGALVEDSNGSYGSKTKDQWVYFPTWLAYAKKIVPAVVIVASLMLIFFPSRQTMLLIAGSEIGERVVTSEAVKGVVDPSIELLKTWIKKETQDLVGQMEQGKKKTPKKEEEKT